MVIFWKIRCFHMLKKCYFDRHLRLHTNSLDTATKYRIEYCMDNRSTRNRNILDFRHLFETEEEPSSIGEEERDTIEVFSIPEYFEDENSNRITSTDIARIATGNDKMVAFSGQYKAHDIRYILAKEPPLSAKDLDGISLSQDAIDTLSYYVRDATELSDSALITKPPSLVSKGCEVRVETIAVEHIRSFVMVFRRLYMTGEKGCYIKACKVFCSNFPNKRSADWIEADKQEYEEFLNQNAGILERSKPNYSFSNKRLVDVFLYTRFAHQPQPSRISQYEKCLAEVGELARLEWMFYSVTHSISCYYLNAARMIRGVLATYLEHTGQLASVDVSPFANVDGRGTQQTREEENQSRLGVFAIQMGEELWKEAGSPEGERENYIERSQETLRSEEE